MTGESMYTRSKERMELEIKFSSERTPHLSITDMKVKCPLRFAFSPLYSATNKEQ